jgi:hypothetical protein
VFTLKADQTELIRLEFAANQLQRILQPDRCANLNILDCHVCNHWKNLTFTSSGSTGSSTSGASGCNEIQINCLSQSFGPFPLGFFLFSIQYQRKQDVSERVKFLLLVLVLVSTIAPRTEFALSIIPVTVMMVGLETIVLVKFFSGPSLLSLIGYRANIKLLPE